MTEIKSIIRSPTKQSETNITLKNERNKPVTKHSVLFDEIAQIHAIDLSQDFEHENYISDANENDINSTNLNNTLAQRVTVKVMEQPAKETITYLELNNSNRECKSELVNNKNVEAFETDNNKKRTPVIKVKVKLCKESCDKTDLENKSGISSLELSSNDGRKSFDIPEKIVESTCISEERNSNSIEKIAVESEQTKHNVENGCIFDENKSRPLSPIPVVQTPVSLHFRAVEDLIDFHERQITRPTGRAISSKVPLMGTNALLNRSHESKLALNDSEIISALVRDRFVVNMFESRSYRRSIRKKPSNYGRIYKSLERTVCTDSPSNGEIKRTQNMNNTFQNIICVKQSSPIQLKEQPVSLQKKKLFSPSRSCSEDYSGDNYVSQNDQLTENDHNSSPPLIETRFLINNTVLSSIHPSDNVVTSKSEQISETEQPTNTLEETSNVHINETKDKHLTSNEEESYCSETTAEMCSSESQQHDTNTTSSNAETEDMCESSVSNLSITNTMKTISEPSLITSEMKQDSVDSIEKLLENSVSTDLSYNMEEFLEKALGEELCNYSNLDSTTEVSFLFYIY